MYHSGSPPIELPPNKVLQRTPLRVERDRSFFEGWNRPESFPDLAGAAAEHQGVSRPGKSQQQFRVDNKSNNE
jgi:hypothetical protein